MRPRVFLPAVSVLLAILHAWWPLIIAADIVAYAIWAYTHSFVSCWACTGRPGRNRGSTKRRWGHCWRCRGSREIQALGSRALHRLVRSAREHIRDRKGW